MDEAFAGIDWASEEHALCVVDESGATLEGELHAHEEAGIEELIARMRALGVCGWRSSARRAPGRSPAGGRLHRLADPPQQAEGDPASL